MITLRCYDSFYRQLGELANFVDADGPSLEYVLSCAPGAIGAMVLTVPATTSLDLFPKDGLLVPYRSIAGRPPVMDNGAVYLVRKRESFATHTRITALHATSLLQRRIINYRSGLNTSSGANYTGKGPSPADDLIYAYVTENLGGSATSAQRIGVSTGVNIARKPAYRTEAFVTVAASAGAGASTAIEAAWRNLFDVCAEIANWSTQSGTYLTFEFVSPREGYLEFRQYTGQRGVDRRVSTANPLILSVDTGTIENAVLTEDWTNEKTVVTAGGAGDGQARAVGSDDDFVRLQDSWFGRIESFYEASNQVSTTALDQIAGSQLNLWRGVRTLSGDLIETPAATRGIHYDLGDYVTIRHRGVQYDVRLDTIQVSVGGGATNPVTGTPAEPLKRDGTLDRDAPGKRRERMRGRV